MTIEWVVERLLSFLQSFRTVSEGNQELADNALRAISHALAETCIYYRKYRTTGHRDEEIETQLSCYWRAAAIPIRHFDKDLSLVCEQKDEHWLNPKGWESEDANWITVELEALRDRYRESLD